jgi:hypothetical protein
MKKNKPAIIGAIILPNSKILKFISTGKYTSMFCFCQTQKTASKALFKYVL